MKQCLVIVLSCLWVLSGCSQHSNAENTETFTYEAYELPLEDKVSLGDGQNEIVFVFDYSCPWCKKWMEDVLPEIESRWLDNGEVAFKGQPLVLLNERSQLLATVDANAEQLIPEQYYEFQRHIASDAEIDDYGTEAYVRRLAETFDVNAEVLLVPRVDEGIQNARLYTRDLGVDYVPTVYVNRIKLLDAFSLEEMEQVIKGEIQVGDQVEVDMAQ
ncbi:DsbA family protein [Exiguobacterium sp.]|uniref:DsbA family protein n=1 Tax=Exiguobacterium sp. TaxID=44751 RepID=UPI00391D6F6F